MSATRQTPGASVDLPAPRIHGRLLLEEALAARRTTRKFAPRHLAPAELSQLLWAAQGRTARAGGRTAPSAGALYPLELYVVLPEALHRYIPSRHRVELIAEGDLRLALGSAALDQEAVCMAPASLVLCGVFARTAALYERRARRYVWLEAGHAAQNVLLEAVALGLGAVPIGSFDDRRLQRVVGLPSAHEPLYVISVGELAD